MRQTKDEIWTWLLPETPRKIDRSTWFRSGGKWIVFDDEDRIRDLAEKLAPHIDAGEIESAKSLSLDIHVFMVFQVSNNPPKPGHLGKHEAITGSAQAEARHEVNL